MARLGNALVLLTVLLAAPWAAAAQTPGDAMGSESQDSVGMKPRISPEMIAFNSMLNFRYQKNQAKTCYDTGCFFVINETADYDAIGLYLDKGSPDPGDAPVWTANLLRGALGPRLARWTYKAGDQTMCALGTKVVLRHRRTRQEITTLGEVSLCKSPRRDTALRINVVFPKVTVEENGKGA
ncbi:hypothetical protein [Sphingomonas sp. M1-B02]|uniref:hypothetical protein n=1 Tax=Sphingomonas sp. M1-B02 TaxID=3114300 RepID=UPI00223FE713|nr:hypothetical protein [Sphingomonas sp. S6-11]UZK67592.1 hypothetical protein OKW87_07120 [Sphingomonas sp. S6-11]